MTNNSADPTAGSGKGAKRNSWQTTLENHNAGPWTQARSSEVKNYMPWGYAGGGGISGVYLISMEGLALGTPINMCPDLPVINMDSVNPNKQLGWVAQATTHPKGGWHIQNQTHNRIKGQTSCLADGPDPYWLQHCSISHPLFSAGE